MDNDSMPNDILDYKDFAIVYIKNGISDLCYATTQTNQLYIT